MAFVLKQDICTEDNCKRFVFTETTGAYHVTNNPTGWGAPNPVVGDAVTATLEIFLPGNTTTTADLTVDLLAEGYPTVDDTVEYTISNTDLGFTAGVKMTDGFYKFVYTITTATQTYRQTITKALSCNAKCCVDGLFGLITDFECDCQEAVISKALTAQAIYKAMISAGACGNTTKYTKLQSMLSRMCDNVDCCS